MKGKVKIKTLENTFEFPVLKYEDWWAYEYFSRSVKIHMKRIYIRG